MPDIGRLMEVIGAEAQALGLELVRVQMMPSEAGEGGQALQIMAEDPRTGQLVLDQCAELSRRVSSRFDELEEAGETLVEGTYHLEVSSPGIDRPLTRERDFADWAGHEARIVMVKGFEGQRVLKGNVVGIESGMVAIRDTKSGHVTVPREAIHSAKLVLTDRLIAETAPLDPAGAEDIVEDTQEEKADD
jgi:ribosome maturation factor RimP